MVFHLSLTNECQCNCFYCSQHVKEGKGEFLPADHAVSLAEKAVELGYDTIELTGGEPLLHPEFVQIVDRILAISADLNVILYTNGILLEQYLARRKDVGIKEIRLHIDSLLAEPYKKITGKAEILNQILGGLWKAVALGIEVEILTKLHPDSEGQLGQILSLAKKYPVHIRVEDLITEKTIYRERDLLLKWKSIIGNVIILEEHVYTGDNWKGSFALKLKNEE